MQNCVRNINYLLVLNITIQLSSNNAFRSTAYIPIKKITLRNRISSILRKYMEEWEEMTRFAWLKPLQNITLL